MKRSLTIWILAGAMVISSCQKNFLNVNNNQNQPTSVPNGFVFANAINQMANQYSTNLPQFLELWMGAWSRSGNYIPDNATETYEISPGYSYSENYWQAIYSINVNLNTIARQAAGTEDSFMVAGSKILLAYNFGQLVDVYNNIPYSEALNVDSLRPVYDDAQTIYQDLFNKIDSGINLLKALSPDNVLLNTDAQYDILFSGNTTSWIQFANTIKLRLLLHVSQVSALQSLITQQLTKISQEGDGFLTAGSGAMVNPGYSNATGKQSPFYGNFGFTPTGTATANNAYFRVNKYATDFYASTNDPRAFYFCAATTSALTGNKDTVAGNYQGDPTALGNSNTSGLGPGILGTATSSTPLLPDFESLFLQAEATQLGWLSGANTAQQLYDQAITQDFVYLGVPNAVAAAQTYFSQSLNDVGWAASSNKTEAIIKQKWIAMNGVDIQESWNDYRRWKLPADIPISLNPHLTVSQIPVRLLYPQTEIDRNPDNVPQLPVDAQFTGKIFWMQ